MSKETLTDAAASHEMLDATLKSDSVDRVYANGFAVVQSNADNTLVLLKNGRPVLMVDMSFNTAKSLVQKLGAVIVQLEKITDTRVLSTDDISAAMQKHAKGEEATE
ncbi:MAG: hypothetical protein ACC655_07010 [Rhodothermia bacterium]